MKILVYFKGLELGLLEEQDGKIFYTSNTKGEKAIRDSFISANLYRLFNSQKKQLKALPYFLKDILKMADTPYFVDKLGILTNQSVFEKLYKLGTLSLDETSFYIKSI